MRKSRTPPRAPRRMALAALIAAGCVAAPAAAQQPGRPGAAARVESETPAPLQVLIESREQLALTPEQIERIRTIRLALVERNEPLVGRMLELRATWQRERRVLQLQRPPGRAGRAQLQRLESAALQRIRRTAGPLDQQIQANNKAAMQEVNALLTREQRQRLRALVEARRTPPGGGPAGASGGGGVGR